MFRPIFHLREKIRQAKRRKAATQAANTLNLTRAAAEKATRSALHTRLSLEMGRGPDAWRGGR